MCASDPTSPAENAPAGAPAWTAKLNVLVVDDDDEERAALVRTIRRMGHTCRGAHDGLEAWEMHGREHADVILSDWQMPRMDGIELCRRTRVADDQNKYTYFLFMTGFRDKEHFIRGLEAGADDYQTKPIDVDELRARLASARRVVSLYRKLAVQNAVLRRDSQASFRIARIDPLTQVANRLSMDEDLKVLWSRAARYGHRYSVAICDIDRFKSHNDRFGHLAGDEVLRRVALTIREHLREGDGLYRYGGEEFLALLPEQSLTEAAHAMDRVRLAIARMAIPAARDGQVVTISCGLAELDRATDRSVDEWIGRADEALYRAKAEGRNRIETAHIVPTSGSDPLAQ